MRLVFLFGLPGNGKTERSEGALRADRVETLPQSFDRGPALGRLPFWLEGIHRTSRTDLALGVCGCRGERSAGLDFHLQSRNTALNSCARHSVIAARGCGTNRGRARTSSLERAHRIALLHLRLHGATKARPAFFVRRRLARENRAIDSRFPPLA